jgi:hypothetical protein
LTAPAAPSKRLFPSSKLGPSALCALPIDFTLRLQWNAGADSGRAQSSLVEFYTFTDPLVRSVRVTVRMHSGRTAHLLAAPVAKIRQVKARLKVPTTRLQAPACLCCDDRTSLRPYHSVHLAT